MTTRVFYILFFASALNLYGQVSLRTYVDTKDLKIGQEVPVYVVGNSKEDFQVKFPAFDEKKMDVLDFQTNKSTAMDENGQVEVEVQLVVWVRPKVAGKIKFGSVLAKQHDKIYRTEPFHFRVKNEKMPARNQMARRDAQVILKSSLSENTVYLHQATEMQVYAYSPNLGSLRNISDIKVEPADGFKYQKIRGPKEEVHEENDIYMAQIAVYLLFPEKAEELSAPAVRAKLTQGGEELELRANQPTLNVIPLPDLPSAGFKNAVGNYSVTMDVKKPDDIRPDQPVSVQVTLKGTGNLKDIRIPKLEESEAYEVFKPTITQHLRSTKDGYKGEVTAEYIVVPKIQGEIKLELEKFVYFNPSNGHYEGIHVDDRTLIVQPESKLTSGLSKLENNAKAVFESSPDPENKLTLKEPETGKEKDSQWLWLVLLVAAGGGGFLILNKRKQKTSMKPPVSITEAIEKKEVPETQIPVEKPHKLKAFSGLDTMETAIQSGDIPLFLIGFDHFDRNLQTEAEASGKTMEDYLDHQYGEDFAERFGELKNEINFFKYSPIKDLDVLKEIFQRMHTLIVKVSE